MLAARAYTARTPGKCSEAYTHMCADVVMLIPDVKTRKKVENHLFWDHRTSKEGGRGRCIKEGGLPSTTPPLLEGYRLCPTASLVDVAGFWFSLNLENVVHHFGGVVDRAYPSTLNGTQC